MSTHPVEKPSAETRTRKKTERRAGLAYRRHFTKAGSHPYDEVTWESRSAVINDERGQPVFEQNDIEVPSTWSQTATNIVASKYFRGQLGSPDRENSVRGLISRVVDTIRTWADDQGYFATPEDLESFSDELTHLLVEQKAAFNSPVWFNVGIEKHPQASACFINSVRGQDGVDPGSGPDRGNALQVRLRDWLQPLLDPLVPRALGRRRHGLRPRLLHARLRRLRRRHQERRQDTARRQDGHPRRGPSGHRWSSSLQGRRGAQGLGPHRRRLRRLVQRVGAAYDSVFFQNANHSVRVTDEFMQAVVEDGEWKTKYVITGEPCESPQGSDVMKQMAEAAWQCGDPGIQFDTTVNDWHTCPNTGPDQREQSVQRVHVPRRHGLQPRQPQPDEVPPRDGGEFDVELSDGGLPHPDHRAGDPRRTTPATRRRRSSGTAHDYRPLGLGYANLGACSWTGTGLRLRRWAGDLRAAITALMHGEAYAVRPGGLFHGPLRRLRGEREPMLRVIDKHRDASHMIDSQAVPRRSCRLPRTSGTRPMSWARSTDTATRRSPCWPRPGRSLHDGLRHDRASSPTSRS